MSLQIPWDTIRSCWPMVARHSTPKCSHEPPKSLSFPSFSPVFNRKNNFQKSSKRVFQVCAIWQSNHGHNSLENLHSVWWCSHLRTTMMIEDFPARLDSHAGEYPSNNGFRVFMLTIPFSPLSFSRSTRSIKDRSCSSLVSYEKFGGSTTHIWQSSKKSKHLFS